MYTAFVKDNPSKSLFHIEMDLDCCQSLLAQWFHQEPVFIKVTVVLASQFIGETFGCRPFPRDRLPWGVDG